MTPLEHLFSAIWLNHNPHKKYVLMATTYTAYFDASGQPGDSPVTFVVGFVSSATKWLRFEAQWHALLKANRLAPPLHMTDFTNGAPPYEAWRENTDKKQAFFKNAIRTIKHNIHQGVVAGIVFRDMKQARRQYEMPLLDVPPYVWCAMIGCKKIMDWGKRHGLSPAQIEFVFERGDQHQHIFEDHCFKKWAIHPIIRSKTSLLAFQPADMLAWEMRRAYIDHESGKLRLRVSAYRMYEQLPLFLGLYDQEGFTKLCQKIGKPRNYASVS